MNTFPAPATRLILGSASPRRAALLRQLGVEFEQIVSPEPEPAADPADPAASVRRSAESKARAVARVCRPDAGTLVIGADTVVVLDGRILGKPRDPRHARSMLVALAGRAHTVYTGVCVLRPPHDLWLAAEATRVAMRRMNEKQIDEYIASGEPLDKAGAYAIQGRGARFIERIEGCYYNVVGLPLARLCALLEQAGYEFRSSPSARAER